MFYSYIYINDGNGNFSFDTKNHLDGLFYPSIATADVDGDGDMDFIHAGSKNPAIKVLKLYVNNGNGIFKPVRGLPFKKVNDGLVAFLDVDQDNDQDVLISGFTNSGIETRLYLDGGIITSSKEQFESKNLNFVVYPNPVTSQTIHISFKAQENREIQIEMFDLTGRLLLQKNQVVPFGEQTLSIDISKLSQGSYWLNVNDGLEQNTKLFFVK